MEQLKKRNILIANITAIASFVVTFVLCAVFGWIDVVGYLFSPSGENIGQVFKMPPTYTIVCLLFFAVLCALVIFGIILKNKLMCLLAASYELIFIIAFILWGLFVMGNITNETVFTAVMYFLTAVFIPVYGIIWHIGALIFLLFIPLVIANIVGIVKAFKKKK